MGLPQVTPQGIGPSAMCVDMGPCLNGLSEEIF